MNEHQKAALKVERMSSDDLESTWYALRQYDSRENYAPGVPMDDWALLVASERSKRAAIQRRNGIQRDIEHLQQIAEKQR